MVGDLETHGFEISAYAPCVANKTLGGKQLTIIWHIDNLKILHVDRRVVSDTIVWLESINGKMYGARGKRHE